MRFCCGIAAFRNGVPVLCFMEIHAFSYCRGFHYNRNYPYQKMLTEGTYYEDYRYEKSEGICVAVPPYFRSESGKGIRADDVPPHCAESCPCLSADIVVT